MKTTKSGNLCWQTKCLFSYKRWWNIKTKSISIVVWKWISSKTEPIKKQEDNNGYFHSEFKNIYCFNNGNLHTTKCISNYLQLFIFLWIPIIQVVDAVFYSFENTKWKKIYIKWKVVFCLRKYFILIVIKIDY